MATFARFYFLDFGSELLLDALAKLHMVGVYLVSHEVYALGDREDPLVGLDLEADSLQHLMDGITNHPQLSLGLCEYQTVVTISEVMLDGHLVFERVVEVNGEDKVACGLRGAKPELMPCSKRSMRLPSI